MSQRLGDVLVKEKIISHEQLEKALRAQREAGPSARLGSVLVKLGFVSDEEVTNFLSRPVFGVFANDAVVKRNLSAFVQCFDTGTAPASALGSSE